MSYYHAITHLDVKFVLERISQVLRRLSTIMAADVVGYSARMREDEIDTVNRLTLLSELIVRIAQLHLCFHLQLTDLCSSPNEALYGNLSSHSCLACKANRWIPIPFTSHFRLLYRRFCKR